MRRGAFLLSVLAAMAGSPLRQAEAAADLTRALVEDGRIADVEALDGGVGDDLDLGVPTAPHVVASPIGLETSLFLLPPPATPPIDPRGEIARRERVWWPQSPPAIRFAWLQVHRF